jgi:molybdate transport system substrate-binding protein
MHIIQKQKFVFFSILTALILVSCNDADSKDNGELKQKAPLQSVMIFAAASLTDVLSEIIDSFEVHNPVSIQTNLASSGTLARQMAQGEIPDIFISASVQWANYIDSMGFFMDNSKSKVAQNELVFIAPISSPIKINAIDSTLNIPSLLHSQRLSMGDPAHVPAGKYAKESLEYFGWYTQLTNKIIPAKDVRSALMVVELEESPLGIVYKTDALKSTKIKILHSFPKQSHKPIVYMGGRCSKEPSAKAFFTYLQSNETKNIWEKYGFIK